VAQDRKEQTQEFAEDDADGSSKKTDWPL